VAVLIIDKSKLLLDKGKFLHLTEENVPFCLNHRANCFHHIASNFLQSLWFSSTVLLLNLNR